MRAARAEEHAAAERATLSDEARLQGVVASGLMRALFPNDLKRRAFLKAVGTSTAAAALATFFPLDVATEAFAQTGKPEKTDLKVGFIPITCATPIIMAHPMGFYTKHGLNVEVVKTAGWAVVRDKTINKEYDAAHMLAPMPLAISQGLGSNPIPFVAAAIENINGQSFTLGIKHKDKMDVKSWKGMKLAIPYDFSMHNYLLRYLLAENGIDPDTDVQLRVVPPPEMVANLQGREHRRLPRPGQRGPARGVRRRPSSTPCPRPCGTGTPAVPSRPARNSSPPCRILTRHCCGPSWMPPAMPPRPRTARPSPRPSRRPPILTRRRSCWSKVLVGKYADGLGNIKDDPKRVDFDPFPWDSFAVWMLAR